MDTQRQMFSGNWKCSGCGAAITQLPFQPDPAREDSLLCRDCHRANQGDRPRRNDRFERRERKMFQGNWTCSECGGAITELPFEPRDTSNLKCRDCFRK